jgi:hypothetical protein
MGITKILSALIWLGIAISIDEAFADLTNEMRGAAIRAHRHGPISYKLFTKKLTGQKQLLALLGKAPFLKIRP